MMCDNKLLPDNKVFLKVHRSFNSPNAYSITFLVNEYFLKTIQLKFLVGILASNHSNDIVVLRNEPK